jgi:hypothetical protein
VSTAVVALVGIIATAAVGIAAPWLTGRLQARLQTDRNRHDREMADLVELRVLLDEASHALVDAEVPAYFIRPGAQRSGSAWKALTDAISRMEVATSRLWVRLGSESPVYRGYMQVQHARLRMLMLAEEGDGTVAVEAFKELFDAERDHTETFFSEASKLVGSRLPAERDE